MDQYLIPTVCSLILIISTFFCIYRSRIGKPIKKAEEQIFTLGILLGGVAMFFGLQSVGVGNFRDSLGSVVQHLVGAIFINVMAMACKMAYSFASKNPTINGRVGEVSSLNDLAEVLRASQKSQELNTEKLVSAMEVNQEKMDINFNKLDSTLNNFVKELGTQLITQIQTVIETLNDKLTEQLGDNFKRLNDAVNNLVIWQDNYKDVLEQLQLTNLNSATQLEKAADSLTRAADKTESFATSANRMEHLIGRISKDYELLVRAQEQMETSLKSLAEVPKVATEKMNEMISTLANSAKDIKTSGEQLSETVQSNSTKVVLLSERLSENINKSQHEVANAMEQSVRNFSQTVGRKADELFEKLNTSTREIDSHLKQGSTSIENTIKQNSQKLYTELQSSQENYSKRLNESVEKLNNQLYSVEEAVEKALDASLREFAKKVTDICVYAVQTAQSAYGTANELRQEIKRELM
jgi:hypothetical protein